MCDGTGKVCATCEGEKIVTRNFSIDAPGQPDLVACPACCAFPSSSPEDLERYGDDDR